MKAIMNRNRIIYVVLITLVIILGLSSRKYQNLLPQFIAAYAGDILWALMVYLVFGFLFPKLSPARISLYAIIFSYAIEISQLYHSPWADVIRRNKLGRLVFGYGFLWSDLLCYMIGAGIGLLFEEIVLKLKRAKS